ncbi:MAG: hypothetical protein IT209_10265 [Armatimonadetes bacterium]|nr:hypothetical protein [Armatimonadota bacterium]
MRHGRRALRVVMDYLWLISCFAALKPSSRQAGSDDSYERQKGASQIA